MTFDFKPWPTLFTILLLFLLLSLSHWQMQRYHFKQDLLKQYHKLRLAPPISLKEALTLHDKRHIHVVVHGHYLNQLTLFLAHRIRHHQMGYEVLTPFQLDDKKRLLLHQSRVDQVYRETSSQCSASIRPSNPYRASKIARIYLHSWKKYPGSQGATNCYAKNQLFAPLSTHG